MKKAPALYQTMLLFQVPGTALTIEVHCPPRSRFLPETLTKLRIMIEHVVAQSKIGRDQVRNRARDSGKILV